MSAAIDWLERYRAIWEANYQRLDALLDELKGKAAIARRKPKKR
jgi:hypothetical protein